MVCGWCAGERCEMCVYVDVYVDPALVPTP